MLEKSVRERASSEALSRRPATSTRIVSELASPKLVKTVRTTGAKTRGSKIRSSSDVPAPGTGTRSVRKLISEASFGSGKITVPSACGFAPSKITFVPAGTPSRNSVAPNERKR